MTLAGYTTKHTNGRNEIKEANSKVYQDLTDMVMELK
jgi:hypothetical protein